MNDLRTFFPSTLQRIQSWLQFAEVKNTVLLAADFSLLVGGLMESIQTDDRIPGMLRVLPFCLLLAAAIFSLGAVLPKTKMPKPSKFYPKGPPNGVIYFEDIARYPDNETYLREITSKLGADSTLLEGKLALDYAGQIRNLSLITSFKMRMAKRAVWLTASGAAVLMLLVAWGRVKDKPHADCKAQVCTTCAVSDAPSHP